MPESKTNDRSIQTYAALSVGFVCLVIGLPLWWKSTEIYRVQLPYHDIESLSVKSLHVNIKVDLVSFDPALSSADLTSFATFLESDKVDGGNDHSVLQFKYTVVSWQKHIDEEKVLQQPISLSDVDDDPSRLLSPLNLHNKYYIFCLPAKTLIKGDYPYLGTKRVIFMKCSDVKVSSLQARAILRDIIIQESTLIKKHHSIRATTKQMPDKESMRSVKSSLAYDVTFSLVIHEPHILDVQWNIRHHINDYLKPFINQLPVNVNVKSQVLSYTSLFVRSQRAADNTSYCRLSDLPHMINPLEAKLSSHVSNNPGLDFIIYIPTRDQSPLFIRDNDGKRVRSNSFLSPQWGGILIYNVPDPQPNASLPQEVTLDDPAIMQVFLTQLRLLLGIHSQDIAGVHIAPVAHPGLHLWELDAFMRARCIENIATVTLTLHSLAQLLAQINNIVINDDIGREVQRAVDHARLSYSHLEDGELIEAFTHSQTAVNASEKAFFDPSLLELLYFPEDQKFAIYIPLFLPISIPVIMSMLQAFKWLRSRYSESKEKKE